LLKAEIDYGMEEITDSSGTGVDSVDTKESYAVLKFNPAQSEIDSIKTAFTKQVR
jgi:hypothetical protein